MITTNLPYNAIGGNITASHCRADQIVTSFLSPGHYNHFRATFDACLAEMYSYYRPCYIADMHHCCGGLGACSLGQMSPLDLDI